MTFAYVREEFGDGKGHASAPGSALNKTAAIQRTASIVIIYHEEIAEKRLTRKHRAVRVFVPECVIALPIRQIVPMLRHLCCFVLSEV